MPAALERKPSDPSDTALTKPIQAVVHGKAIAELSPPLLVEAHVNLSHTIINCSQIHERTVRL